MSKAIRKKMFEVQKKIIEIKKTATNDYLSKNGSKAVKYAELDAVIEKVVDETATALNLLVLQSVQRDAIGPYLYMQVVDVETDEEITGQMPLILDRDNMQGLGSAVTYARRYSLLTMFGVAQKDDDGNGSSPKANSTQKTSFSGKAAEKPATQSTKAAGAPRTNFGPRTN